MYTYTPYYDKTVGSEHLDRSLAFPPLPPRSPSLSPSHTNPWVSSIPVSERARPHLSVRHYYSPPSLLLPPPPPPHLSAPATFAYVPCLLHHPPIYHNYYPPAVRRHVGTAARIIVFPWLAASLDEARDKRPLLLLRRAWDAHLTITSSTSSMLLSP
jgi:hypothetical protein